MMGRARVRVQDLTARGQLLLDGKIVDFELTIEDGVKISADFPKAGPDVDIWRAFKALEKFVEDNLRG